MSASRSKGIVFAVGTLPERDGHAVVEALQLAELVPRHRVPTGLVRPLALHRLEDQFRVEQFLLGPRDDIDRFPAARREERARQQEPPVVVAMALPGHLQQQRLGGMRQAQEGRRVEYGPGHGHEPARIAPSAPFYAFAAHSLPRPLRPSEGLRLRPKRFDHAAPAFPAMTVMSQSNAGLGVAMAPPARATLRASILLSQ